MQKSVRQKAVCKVKILMLCKSTNKNFKNSHLLWLKYFLLNSLKIIFEVKTAVFSIQNCLPRGLGLQCIVRCSFSRAFFYCLCLSSNLCMELSIGRV
jgi:hypothetical protein